VLTQFEDRIFFTALVDRDKSFLFSINKQYSENSVIKIQGGYLKIKPITNGNNYNSTGIIYQNGNG
jgi:hypothetical protein